MNFSDISQMSAGVLPKITLELDGYSLLPKDNQFWLLDPSNQKWTDHDYEKQDPKHDHSSNAQEEMMAKSLGSLELDNPTRMPAEAPALDLDAHDKDSSEQVNDTFMEQNINVPSLPVQSLDQELDYPFNCRCGASGNGHLHANGEPLVCCDICENWSHISCQREGRASTLRKTDKFICDFCTFADMLPAFAQKVTRRSSRANKQPVALRLLAGKGALAQFGDFWYPVRLIQKQRSSWRVKWWRGCQFNYPDEPSEWIPESQIVDELWGDKRMRRTIRVSLFVIYNFIDCTYS